MISSIEIPTGNGSISVKGDDKNNLCRIEISVGGVKAAATLPRKETFQIVEELLFHAIRMKDNAQS